MRWINGFFCVVMALFAVVQYNDPDAVVWFLIYAIPAVWAGIAAFRPGSLAQGSLTLVAFGLCFAAAVVGSIYLWPSQVATWWDNEEVREGLGMMIVTVALLAVGISVLNQRREPTAAGADAA